MKAININGQIKVFNRLPNVWNNTHGYNKLDPAQHYADGWRDVVQPTIDPETEKRGGEIFFDETSDHYTYPVIPLTAEQQEAYQQAQLDRDETAQELQRHKDNGIKYFDRAIAEIERMFKAGEITGAEAKDLVKLVYSPIEPLYKGQFRIAKINLAALEHPYTDGDPEKDFLSRLWQKINEYLNNNVL